MRKVSAVTFNMLIPILAENILNFPPPKNFKTLPQPQLLFFSYYIINLMLYKLKFLIKNTNKFKNNLFV